MKPTKFKGHNVVYAENQPQYIPLPVYKREDGVVTAFWKAQTFLERCKMFWHGGVYVSVMTFNCPLQPTLVSVNFEQPASPDIQGGCSAIK